MHFHIKEHNSNRKWLIFHSKAYGTHSRLVYDPTGTLLAILYRKVPHMLHAKYQLNLPGGSGEEEF